MENTTFVLYSPKLDGYLSDFGYKILSLSKLNDNRYLRTFKTCSEALEQKEDMIGCKDSERLPSYYDIEVYENLEIHEIILKPVNIIK